MSFAPKGHHTEARGQRPVKAGESFSAAHIVGYFDAVEEMHVVNDKYKGHTGLAADAGGWRLVK
jgi:hypothetical protein